MKIGIFVLNEKFQDHPNPMLTRTLFGWGFLEIEKFCRTAAPRSVAVFLFLYLFLEQFYFRR